MFLFGASIGGCGITAARTVSQLCSGRPCIQFGFRRASSKALHTAMPGMQRAPPRSRLPFASAQVASGWPAGAGCSRQNERKSLRMPRYFTATGERQSIDGNFFRASSITGSTSSLRTSSVMRVECL